jgi:hypothetical protein
VTLFITNLGDHSITTWTLDMILPYSDYTPTRRGPK